MGASQSDFQKHFSGLSDAALLEVRRDDLVEAATVFYDREMDRRGFQAETEEAPATELSGGEELVNVVEFESADDARQAQEQLKKNGIPAFLAVAVPAAFATQAIKLLDPGVSDEELAALAESAQAPEEET
jgi:hypothetical protein